MILYVAIFVEPAYFWQILVRMRSRDEQTMFSHFLALLRAGRVVLSVNKSSAISAGRLMTADDTDVLSPPQLIRQPHVQVVLTAAL